MPDGVEGHLDEIFERMAKGLSKTQRQKANQKAAELYKDALTKNFDNAMKGHGESIIKTLTTHNNGGGGVEVGFSKEGKKGYLARFQNDGWIPKNQYGGPYTLHNGLPMVPGKHFWEETNREADVKHGGALGKAMTNEQKAYYKHVMDKRVHGGE